MSDEKIIKRDDKLLKNEKSWRRARIATIIIAIGWISVVFFEKKQVIIAGEIEAISFSAFWAFFWIVIVDWLNLRLSHIDSIKLYRNKIK